MDSRDQSISKTTLDPAADAAAMLLRLGFAIFAIVIPSATLMSRWVIVVLVPIAAVLIILASILRGNPFRVLEALGAGIGTLPGLTALFLAIWAIISVGWTPDPAVAGVKIFKTLGVIFLGLLAVHALPKRMRASNLHLVSIGVALGAILILAAAVNDALGAPFFRFPAATPGRSAVLLACLGWAAAAWLLIKNRQRLAIGLVGLVFLAAIIGPTGEAILPIGIGLIIFALAWAVPERAGNLLAILAAALVACAPLLAFLADGLRMFLALPVDSAIGNLALWWDTVRADPVAILTGRGFDSAAAAREAGRLPLRATATLISDIWYDLGLIGAAGVSILVFFLFRATGRLGLEVAPLALAGLGAAFAFTFVERGATQTWWMNGMTVLAIVLVSVDRGRYRTVRPRASLGRSMSGRNPEAHALDA
jgi:hypothetical protein